MRRAYARGAAVIAAGTQRGDGRDAAARRASRTLTAESREPGSARSHESQIVPTAWRSSAGWWLDARRIAMRGLFPSRSRSFSIAAAKRAGSETRTVHTSGKATSIFRAGMRP